MVPALWTGILAAEPLPQALQALRALGWQHFELSTEHLERIDQDRRPQARIAEARQALAELGATMPQAHAYLSADVAHPDPARRQADLAVLARHLAHCAALGIGNVVMHPGTGGSYTTRDELRQVIRLNIEAFSRLGDRAGELGLVIALENTMDLPRHTGRVFGAHPHELLDLLDKVHSPALGIAFDSSHANCQKLNLPAAVQEYGPLLRATHISDNDGSGDQHRMPGVGNIDWPALVAALRAAGYRGLFNLEIPGERHPVREILDRKLRHAREVAEWLVGER